MADLLQQLIEMLGLGNPSAGQIAPAPAPGAGPTLGGAPAPAGPAMLGGPPPKESFIGNALRGIAGAVAAGGGRGGILGDVGRGLSGSFQALDQHKAQLQQDQQQRMRDFLLQRQVTRQDADDAADANRAAMLARIPPPNGMDPATWANLPDETKLDLYTKSVTPKDPSAPKTAGGMQYNADAKQWEAIPGYAEQAGAIAAAGRAPAAPPSPEPLVQVQGQNGPVYVTRSQALGMAPPQTEQHRTADQQDWDILNYGDPSSREFHAAYARQTQPKMQLSADGTRLVPVPPQLPKDLRQPVYSNQGPGGNAGGGTTAPNPGAPPPPDAGGTGAVPTVDLGKKTPTQEQSNAAGFATRTETANSQLEGLLQSGYRPSVTHLAAMGSDGVTGMLANKFLLSDQDQQFDQARRNFINATLRRESGAAISPGEFDNANKQYFPMPGDSDAVLAQKSLNRKQVIDSLKAGSGPAAVPTDGGGGNVPIAGGGDAYGGGALASPKVLKFDNQGNLIQ